MYHSFHHLFLPAGGHHNFHHYFLACGPKPMGQECIMISIFVLCALPIGGGGIMISMRLRAKGASIRTAHARSLVWTNTHQYVRACDPKPIGKGSIRISIIIAMPYLSHGRYHSFHHYCLACGRKPVRQAHIIISIIILWPVAPNLLEKGVS